MNKDDFYQFMAVLVPCLWSFWLAHGSGVLAASTLSSLAFYSLAHGKFYIAIVCGWLAMLMGFGFFLLFGGFGKIII